MDDLIDQMIGDAVASYNEPTAETTSAEGAGAEGAAPSDQEPQAAKQEEVTPETVTEAAKGSTKVQELVDKKYGGDWDKFTDSLYEQWNSTSKLAKEIQDLKSQLTRKETPEEPEIDDKSPQLDLLNAHVAHIDSELKANETSQAKLIQAYGKLEKDIAKWEGKLEASDDLERPAIEDKLDRLRSLKEGKEESYQEAVAKADRLKLEKQQAAANLQWAKTQLKQERQQQLQARAQEEAETRQTLSEFVEAIKTSASEFRIPKANLAHMANVIRGEIAVHLRKLGPNAEAIDMPKAVKERVAAYAKAMGLSSVAPKITPGKPGVPTKAATAPQVAPSDKKVKTAKDADAFATEVFKQFGLM